MKTRQDAAIAVLSSFIDEHVRSFNRRYQVMYGLHVPDPNAEAAASRYKEVNQLWNECVTILVEIKQRGEAARVPKKQMEQLRKPLGIICQRIQTEMQFLKDFGPNVRMRFDKIGALLRILERAKAGGFELTEEENSTLKLILDDREAAFVRIKALKAL